jgi:hypothetical protein
MVAIGKVVFTSREHIIALEARDKGMMGITLNGRDAGASAISLSSRLAAGARDAQDGVRPSCGSDTHRLQPAADRA